MLAKIIAAIAVIGTALIGLLLLTYTCWKRSRQNKQDSTHTEAVTRVVHCGFIK
jgi:CHASE3 domain sensor protein